MPSQRKRWTRRREAAFLDHLAVTCNVTAALKLVQISSAVAYKRRREVPAFAAAWDAAVRTGYGRLEAMLLARAGAATADALAAVDAGTVDPDLAMRLLAMHGTRMAKAAAGTTKPNNRVRRATPEETDRAILKQLAALDRRSRATRK